MLRLLHSHENVKLEKESRASLTCLYKKLRSFLHATTHIVDTHTSIN